MEFIISCVLMWGAYQVGKVAATLTDEEMLRRLIKKQLDGRLLEMSRSILADEYNKVNDKLLERKDAD